MIRISIVLLSLGCTPASPSNHATNCPNAIQGDPYSLAESVCNDLETYCQPDDAVFNQRATCGLITTWSPTACARDLNLCAFVLYHERAHSDGLSDENDADCWAAREAVRRGHREYVDAAICSPGVDIDRASRIAVCSRG